MANEHNDRDLNTLVSDLTRQASDLLRKETELAKAEIAEKIGQAKSGLVMLMIGAVVMLAGLFYLLDAIVYGVSELLPAAYSPWLAALLVGLAFGAVGYLLIKKAQETLKPSNLTPHRTAESLRRDKNVIQEQV